MRENPCELLLNGYLTTGKAAAPGWGMLRDHLRLTVMVVGAHEEARISRPAAFHLPQPTRPDSYKEASRLLPGPTFYDESVFATYRQRREDPDNPNNTLEKPVLLELLGDLAGLRLLDLACGDAAFGREALALGARGYTGIDGSANMVAAARQTLDGSGGTVAQATIEGWVYPPAAFDLVLSRLALHYVEDFAAVCAQIRRTLTAGGRFVFSVDHPGHNRLARHRLPLGRDGPLAGRGDHRGERRRTRRGRGAPRAVRGELYLQGRDLERARARSRT